MIGSLLFYVFYPLSRFLTGRPPEASKQGLPPAVVNGTTVWNGGADTTRRFTQSQETMLEDSWTKTETKEKVKNQSPEKEDDKKSSTHKEQLVAVLREETENETVKMQQNKEEVPKPEDVFMVLHWKQNTEDAVVFPNENITPEQALVAQLKCLKTDDCPVHEQVQMHTSEESIIPAEDDKRTIQETPYSAEVQTQSIEEPVIPVQYTSIHEATCAVQKQTALLSMEESVTTSEAAGTITECWDEYIVPAAEEMHGGVGSPQLVFASPLFNTGTCFDPSQEQNTQTGWHFPAGPGLAEEVQCPLWQFPAMSYYPSVEATLPFEVMWRVWEEMDEDVTAAEPALIPFPFTKVSMDFTVMSYNILAQDLLEANQELYIHCPLEVLDWSYRCSVLLEEIMKWAPDILCLQEVQENHYNEHLYPVLSQMGYTCVYKRRTGMKTDGCATCFRSSCFSEVSVTELEYFRPETELLNRHNVGIVLLLRPVVNQGSQTKVTGPPLCVANTHLLFNPRRGDVKLAQLAIMLAEISSVVKSCAASGEHCNVVLCGDFNSVPNMPLYQLITTGKLFYHGLPTWMVSGQEDLSYKTHCHKLIAPLWPSCLGITDNCQYTTVKETSESQHQKSGKCQYSHDFMLQLRYCPAACVRPADLELIPGITDNTPDASRLHQPSEKSFRRTLSHQLDLQSVYKHILPGSGSSEVTSLHSEVGATVDYIFYSPRHVLSAEQKADGNFVSQGLKLTGCLSLLSEDVLWSMKGLPNHIFPSDHLSLLAKFQVDLNAA